MKLLHPASSLVLLTFVAGCAAPGARPEAGAHIEHIEPSEATGTSVATVVEDIPLAHTDQFYAFGQNGDVVGVGDLEAQVRQVLHNIQTALRLVGSDLRDLAKLNVYLAESISADQVTRLLPAVLPAGSHPAVSFVCLELPYPDALVAADAVAVARGGQDAVSFYRSDSLYSPHGQASVGFLPAGPKVYVSGQAEPGHLTEGAARTMVSLHATLAYLGLSADDVVQVKAFVNTMADADSVEAKIGEYYRNRPAPPVVVTEWREDSLPAEIELIASARRAARGSGDVISYVTPPGMASSPVFSRVARVNRGRLIFVSGLHAAGKDVESQIRAVFDKLERVLREAGSDFNHLVKATYYHSTDEAGSVLNDVRRELYDSQRPPAASKIRVRGVGFEDATISMDMIAVVAR